MVSWIDYSLSVMISLPVAAFLVLAVFLAANKKHAMGKPTINPLLFFTGKFLLFGVLALFWFTVIFPQYRQMVPLLIQKDITEWQKMLSAFLLIPANLMIIPAFLEMGLITHIGLPQSGHRLKTGGIYKISRNPMYLSFYFLAIATFLYLPSLLLLGIMIYGLIVHHFIILKEEQFLEKEFGEQYRIYREKVPRYID